MTTAAEPVESGAQYLITGVGGRAPAGLTDFAGEVSISMAKNGKQLEMVGCGAEASGEVRFHQKDPGLHERDVRVWTITEYDSGRFSACPNAAF
ncbi:MAG: hypothetical protein ABWZ02_10590 [Nakamurella sp.]